MTKPLPKATQFFGRYAPIGGLRGPELPREGARAGGKIRIVHGHEIAPSIGRDVDDEPAPGRKRRQRVAINALTDVLEYEHQRGRISAEAYAAGRYVDRLLEAASGRRTGQEFGERNRAALSPFSLQQALALRIDAARDAARLREAMAREVGAESARIVALVVGDGLSFRAIARLDRRASGKAREGAPVEGRGRDCERAARRIGGLFREGLEALAAAWEKQGRPV